MEAVTVTAVRKVALRLFLATMATAVVAAGCGATAGPSVGADEPWVPTAVAEEAACALPARLLATDIEVIPTTKKIVALTFDAGASAAGVRDILRVLENREAKATFFLTGAFASRYPVRSRRIATAHVVGNHTYDHPDLTTLTSAAVLAQIADAERTILTITGENPRPYFRFPFGARDTRTIGLVNGSCYVAVRWTVDTLGWRGTSGGQTVDTVVARVRRALRPGAIVLMHVGANPTDGSTLDADALGRVIRMVRDRGYRVVTLERLLPSTP